MKFVWKAFLGTAAAIAVVAVTVELLAVSALDRWVERESEERVAVDAHMLAPLVERALGPGDKLDTVALRAAIALAGIRITVVALDGRVLFDSHAEAERMDDHSARTEVLTPGRTVTRFSRTLGTVQTYHAVRVERGGEVLGYARVSLAQREVEARAAALVHVLRLGYLAGGALALLLSVVLARRLARPLVEIAAVVGEVGRVGGQHRLPVRGVDEVSALAAAINTMSRELHERMERIARDRSERDAVLSAMTEGVVAVDRERRVLFANSQARALLSIDAEDPRGRPLWELTRAPEVADAISRCIEARERVQISAVVERAPGERVLQLGAAPLADEGGGTRGCVLVLHDVTELRRLEAVRSDFVANVSHELKTPLTSMHGYVEAVLDDPDMDPETRRAFLEKAHRNTDRLAAILADLLELSRLESDEGALELEPVDLLEVAQGALAEAEEAARARDIELVLAPADERLVVSAERRALGMAVGNLVDNAVKYSPVGGRVDVRLGRAGASAWIEVADRGPGIPAHLQERVFERFFRVDKNRSRKLGGTGLGLSIVRHVAQKHGGRVRLESVPGRGSTFRIELPVGAG